MPTDNQSTGGGGGGYSSTLTPSQRHVIDRPNWEYRVERLSDNKWDEQQSILTNLGSVGWELIAMLDGVAYLKRQV